MSDQVHAPAALHQGQSSPVIRGWVGPRVCLDAAEKEESLLPKLELWILGRPARRTSMVYSTILSASQAKWRRIAGWLTNWKCWRKPLWPDLRHPLAYPEKLKKIFKNISRGSRRFWRDSDQTPAEFKTRSITAWVNLLGPSTVPSCNTDWATLVRAIIYVYDCFNIALWHRFIWVGCEVLRTKKKPTCCLLLSRRFLARFILWPWRCRRYVPPKRRLTFSGL
jgi:hypothetical protein